MKWFQRTVLCVLTNAALILSKPTAKPSPTPGANEKSQSMEMDHGGDRNFPKK